MTWEDRLKQLMVPGVNNYPYRIVQVKPNRKIDEEIYSLSGREEDIAANGSLFLALYDLAQRDRIDFDEWFEQWSLGFPLMNVNRETSNYPLLGNNQWRKPEARPRFKDLTPPELRHKLTYRTIEIWLNRELENESVILSGTDLQLVNHCIQLEYEAGGSRSTKNKGGAYPRLSGQPLIRLYFCEDAKLSQRSASKALVTGEITLRIMDRSDDPKSNLNKISKADLIGYATKIRDLFGTGGGYVWDKGKLTASYRSRNQGFEGWYFVRTRTDGEMLISKLLEITGQTLDRTKLFFSENGDPNVAFPSTPETILVLGDSIQRPQRRPNVSVRFQKAEIELSLLPDAIALVEGDRIAYIR